MKSNLLTRFLIIFAAIALAIVCVWSNGLKGGIDLSGGTDLVYQLNVPRDYQGSPNHLAQQVISILRRRVDPDNVHNLVWRVLSGARIEIEMPLADQAARQAQQAYHQLILRLQARNLQPSSIRAAVTCPAAQRQAAMQRLAGGDQKLLHSLEALAERYDRLVAARKTAAPYQANPTAMPTAVLAELNAAQQAYATSLQKVLNYNINVQNLANLFSANYGVHNPHAEKSLNDFLAAHPARRNLVQKLQVAYNFMRAHSGGLDDPAELERLLRGAGVLDFRITVNPSNPQAAEALAQLRTLGPHRGLVPYGTAWFEIDPRNGQDLLRLQSGYVIGYWQGRHYILLHTNAAAALTHHGRAHWKVQNAVLATNPNTGELMVDFNLDPAGGAYMGQLTRRNKGRDMAILLDNKAITAPVIRGTISQHGEITLGVPSATQSAQSIQQQGRLLTQILNAGSLPATLQSQPISVQTIGATLGADNLRAGLRSAMIAFVVVLFFMFFYYTITGAFADVALLMNLLLLLGVMSMLQATFTLPGIAGVVLTLGMAVDANILINERIREELRKGASLWLAVKQGYDRVFWTIFDANLTTSLTSIVLIFVGSEEVKGFGVTLLIGLAVHMFTALFVTRTLMIAAIRFGVMKKIDDLSVAQYFRDLATGTWFKGRWPFMRVFTVTNFDWIGKRRIFWTISAVIMIAGIIAFIARGNRKYDTEFNGGTQITLHLRPGKSLPVAQVRRRIEHLGATIPALRALRHATVYSIGTRQNAFQIITSIVNPTAGAAPVRPSATPPVQLLSRALEHAFADVLKVTPSLTFQGVHRPSAKIRDLLSAGLVMPITRLNLADLIPGAPRADLSDFSGGAAVVLRHITPAASAADLESRLSAMAQEPDFAAQQYWPLRVIGLRAFGKQVAPMSEPVTEAVVVTQNPNLLYPGSGRNVSAWRRSVAAAAWHLVRTALTTSGGLAGVTSFAPQVASEARINAITSVLLSLILIVAYVWIRFGGVRYGFGVIFSLVHDAIVAVAGTVLAVYLSHTAVGHFLLVSNFKINMTMIAAYLTIIGYSVNDTIVIFDRVRENRGRSHQPLTAKLVNDSINQCFGRTIWTTFTVFAVVAILYIWGGPGVHGFAYAMLIGVFTGAYSTLAIASPMLLHRGQAAPAKTAALPATSALERPRA